MSYGLTKCFVCGTNHDPSDRSKCPTLAQANFRQHRRTKQRISKSFADAVKSSIQTENYYDSLSSMDEGGEDIALQTFLPVSSDRQLRKRPRTVAPKRTAKDKAGRGTPTNASTLGVGGSSPSTSAAGNVKSRKSEPPPSDPNVNRKPSVNQLFQSIVFIIKAMVSSLVECLPISSEWRRLGIKGVDYLLDTLLPILVPFLSPILTSE